jgi:molecular chaperone DnaJ
VPKRLTPAAEDAVKVLEAELGDPRPRITAAVQQGGAR